MHLPTESEVTFIFGHRTVYQRHLMWVVPMKAEWTATVAGRPATHGAANRYAFGASAVGEAAMLDGASDVAGRHDPDGPSLLSTPRPSVVAAATLVGTKPPSPVTFGLLVGSFGPPK